MSSKLYLPFTVLPVYYTKLLMANYYSNLDFFDQTIRQVYETPELLGLVKAFILTPADSSGKKIGVDDQLRSLGWLGLRDRLAMLFLDRAREGKFMRATDTAREGLNEILEFEKRVRDISVDGHARSFLLGFYMKINQFKQTDLAIGGEKVFGVFPRTYLQLMLENKSRTIRIDWLLILGLQLYYSVGQENFKQIIKVGNSFESIWKNIRDSDAKAESDLILNLLRYGSSIGDTDFFSAPLVGVSTGGKNTKGSEQSEHNTKS